MKRLLVVLVTAVIGLILLFTFVQADYAATITVTSAADAGTGTLRQALLDAGNGDTIVFDTAVFPPANPVSITLTSEMLPPLAGGVTINSSSAGVILNGSALAGGNGLIINTADNIVQGLQIVAFPEHGIFMGDGAQNNLIGGLNGSPGGECSGACNLIHSNGKQDIWLEGNATSGNIISGNYIGVNRAADSCYRNLSNAGESIAISYGANHNRIGGTTAAERNVTGCGGVYIGRPGSDGSLYNEIINNYIGVNADDTAVFQGDFYQGVLLWYDGSHTKILSNTIRGMMGQGIWVGGWEEADDVLIQGNRISGNGRDGGSWINQGIRIDVASRVTLRQNSIYDNNGPAIDLRDGANEGSAAPIIAAYDSTSGTANGTACANCLIEIYSDDGDEGEWYEGQTYADANGDWSFAKGTSFQAAHLHATATDAQGNSSSFAVSSYVDVSGTDTPNCSDPAAPCASVAFALMQASQDDTILVAQGIYTENINIDKRITLMGGYESANWQYDPAQYETILDGSNSSTILGDWDGNKLRHPRVIFDDGQYRMWYDGQNPTYPNWGWAMGMAESSDGLSWSKHDGNPVLEPGDEGEWDSMYRGQAAMMKDDDGLYKTWYSGSDGGIWQTGYATSTNGIDWAIYDNNPVLATGAEGSWDEQEANGPAVIKDGGIYQMWYHGCNADYSICSIGYATSANGLDWVKHPGNPVLTGAGGEWDESYMFWPSVVKDGSTYKMWYLSLDGEIGLATSPDGVSWTKYADNPVLSEGWDGVEIKNHTVITDSGSFKMWLNSGTGASLGIGYAESTDGISWTMSISNPVLASGTPGVLGDPVVNVANNNHGVVLDGLTVINGDGYVAGGVLAGNSDLTIQNCYIHDNQAYGDNWWGGGGVLGDGVLTIKDSVIADNHVQVHGGSGIRTGSNGTLNMSNTMVVGNSGDDSIHLNGGGHLVNVTIADNGTDVGRPGVLHNPHGGETLTITNSIIAGNGNGAGDAIHDVAGVVNVSYSYIEGGWSGAGNIDTNVHPNPGFIDAVGGDYHLTQESVCVDAGTAVPLDHDFEGDSRPIFNGYDIGADEVSAYATPIPATGGQIVAPDGTTMNFPAGAFGEDVVIEYSPQSPTDTGALVGAGVFYELTAVYANNGQPAELESGYTYTITVSYDEADLPPNVDEADLQLFYFDGAAWLPEPTSQVDTIANLITATPDHFSLWGVLARPSYIIYLPVVLRP